MATLVPANSVVAERSTPGKRFDVGRFATVVLFLLPAVVIYTLFLLVPLIQAGYYGFFKWNGLGPATDFVGLDNYRRVINDEVFQSALTHNIIVLTLSVLVQLPIALGFALLVGRQMKGRAFFRTVFFLPYVLSEVVAGVIWSFLYLPNSGFNKLFESIIPGYEPRGWLGDTSTVLIAIFIVLTWKYMGFYFILFLAGLQGIPRELEESALIDGASPLRVKRDVTIPLLGPTIRLSIFLSVVGSFQLFDIVWVMTTGGPVNASETMATYMYNFAFRRFALGYGAAVSLVIFLISFGFALLYQALVMRRDYSTADA